MTASDRTKQLLANGLKELMAATPMSRIRVKELCERCGVDRRTFYYHFRDVYDLAAWIFDQTVDMYIPFLDEADTIRGVEIGLRKLREDEVFYRRALSEDSQNALGRHMLNHMVERYMAALRQVKGREELTEEEAFSIGYHCFGCLGMVRRWLFQDKGLSPAELADLFQTSMPPVLRGMYGFDKEKGPHPSSSLRETPDAAFSRGEGK